MKLYGSSPRISTIFDEKIEHPAGNVHASALRNTLRRIFPDPFFFDQFDEERLEELKAQFDQVLPLMKWSFGENALSLFFLTRHKPNSGKFFYEMISRWLMPGRRVEIPFFYASDFQLPDFGPTLYTLAEMVVRLNSESDVEQLTYNLRIIETEIKLGMVSIYHASRILDVHSSHTHEKSTLVQDKIATLIQKRPDQIDYDIFGELQHFLVMSKEEFKAPRDPHHLSRLITCFYLFRKFVEQDQEDFPERRHVHVKISPVKLNLPWGWKQVLGICVGLNFLRMNELFEEKHLMKALQNVLPDIKLVPDSFFVNEGSGHKIHTLYLEVEKEEGAKFSLAEMAKVRRELLDEVKRSIEVVLRPLFMPRNEEEVIRHVLTLSGQLRFVRDLPQVVLAFEKQTETDLIFNVILVRILMEGMTSIENLFTQKETFLTFIPDRVKRVGMLRKKYPKEATIFQVRFPSHLFLRDDYSVDLYKARHGVIVELQKIVGEVRDYNGGMISKQLELLSALKEEIRTTGELTRPDELLLESFFHALYPIEMRSLLPPAPLKKLFFMWKELLQAYRKELLVSIDSNMIYVVGRKDFSLAMNTLEPSENQLLVARLETAEERFWGYIYFYTKEEECKKFLSLLDRKAITS